MKLISALMTLLALAGFSGAAMAGDYRNSTLGVSGYDLVAYHTDAQPLRGNGHHVSQHEGVTYLFSSKKNRTAFEADPAKYLPAYGGWCAFGVSVGKKFVGDPQVWKLVDGRLYLNLDKNIQQDWQKNIAGRISKADANWAQIRDKSPAEL
ncbi:MAG: YHS domain-containing (seleno)protein [Panacagrimonas sp.]